MFCYPRWPVDPPRLWQFLPWVALLAAAGWLAARRGDPGPAWRRHALLGLGWFFLNLLPVLGFIPMSYQMRYSWVADHFAYISLVGTVGLAAAAIGWVPVDSARPGAARAALAAAVAALGLWLAWSGHRYAGKFTDEDTLWTYTHRLNPGAWSAETEARRLMVSGNSLLARGKTGEAAAEFEAALKLNPQYAQAHNNLGKAFFQEGRLDEAMAHFAAALSLDPQLPEAHNNLGAVLEKLPGRLPDAILEFEEAVRLDPGDAGNRHNLGMALAQSGRLDEAIPQLVAALRIKPDFADAHNSLGIALAQSGRLPEALAQFAAAVRLDPRQVPARKNLTFALAGLQRTDEAVDSCAEWIRLAPDDPNARQTMETLLRAAGRADADRPQSPSRP
jgi:tetratricopeptide (TPR) repeat protein